MKKTRGGQLYLRDIRKKYGWTQTYVAKGLGVTQTYYSLVESGKRVPSMDFMDRLSSMYGLPLAVVLWGSVNEGFVSGSKLEIYRQLKPVIDKLIEDVFFD